MRISNFIIVLTLAGILIISGCGSSDGENSYITEQENSEITITGKLAGDEFVQQGWFDWIYKGLVSTAYAVGGRPDKVVVVSKAGATLKDFEIGDDGVFEIEIAELKEDKFILFVQNTVTGEVSGHIKLQNRQNIETIDILDGSTFKGDLQLGTMDVDTLSGPDIEDTDAFEEEDKELFKEVANNDDAVVSHKNKLTNSGIASRLAISFNLGAVTDVTDIFFDISTFSKEANFKGMMPLFYYYGDEAETLENVTLYPPESILHSNPGNTRDDLECNIPADQYTGMQKVVSYNQASNMVTIETAYVDSLPKGNWNLINDDTGTTLGSFVFSDAKPFNSSSVFKSFVPVPKINTDSDDYLTSVTLKFNRYDNSGSKPVNKHFFEILCENLLISYVLAGDNSSQNLNLLEADDESIELTFEPPAQINIADLDRLIISYNIGEAKYQFFVE